LVQLTAIFQEANPRFSVVEASMKAGKVWAIIKRDMIKKYENQLKDSKEKYEEDYKKWFNGGGKEAIKQAKKDRMAGGGGASGSMEKLIKANDPDPHASWGQGSKGFKSQEFIVQNESSNNGDDGD
jgi:hypothetical protein